MHDVFQTDEQLPWIILLSLLEKMAKDPCVFVSMSVNNSWLLPRPSYLIPGSSKSHGTPLL